ncbi:MAG: cytochrome D1 domain-containing protein [Pseudomonadota bacterium]
MSKLLNKKLLDKKILLLSLLLFGSYAHANKTLSETYNKEKTASLFQKNCASCHGEDRLGLIGPPLIPTSFKRLKPKSAAMVIKKGRLSTQMPAFEKMLSDKDINHLVEFIFKPLAVSPKWDLADIKKSHKVFYPKNTLPDTPSFKADMQNLFVVVELGDHHVTVLDGDSFKAITRFKTHNALHGGPKYSSDGRYVYFASRDGWVTKYDLYNLKIIAEIRVGINTRNVAVSADNKYVIVGNTLPHTAIILNADNLSPIKLIPIISKQGISSRVSAVYTAAPRNSFILALKDIPEVWEIPYIDKPVFVHDYHYELPEYTGQKFSIRRLTLDNYLDDFFLSQDYRFIIGTARSLSINTDKKSRSKHKILGGQVIDLVIGKKIAELDIAGMPHLSSGISWKYKPTGVDQTRVLAIPNIKDGSISIFDMANWKKIKTIKTLGPGFFMRSHANSQYAWVDVFFGPDKDAMHIIDKQKLEIVKTLRPTPGKTSAHVEFTKNGDFALLSIWDKDGELIIYNAKTLKEVKRLKMKKPSGKYNVYNKTHLEEGTSH